MAKSIALIIGHPDPDPGRLDRSLAKAYADGAKACGHSVEIIDIAALDFPMLRSVESYENEGAPKSLLPAQQAILKADHLVFIFPLWLGGMPALLKGFLEQVLHRKDAFANPEAENEWPKGTLKGKSARIIVTMGMPAFIFRLWFLAHGVRVLERSILKLVGVNPVRSTLLGGAGHMDQDKLSNWRAKLEKLGRHAN